MKKKPYYLILYLILFLLGSCNAISGEYSLGNHLSLWDNDKNEERIIVYCEGDCNGGIYVVPTYERHYDSDKQHVAEYVEKATSNKKWVIAKTIRVKEKMEAYYIINKDFDITGVDCAKANCDSILQSHVIGPMNIIVFKKEKNRLNITLDFK